MWIENNKKIDDKTYKLNMLKYINIMSIYIMLIKRVKKRHR